MYEYTAQFDAGILIADIGLNLNLSLSNVQVKLLFG